MPDSLNVQETSITAPKSGGAPRRAVLVFADHLGIDLAKRRLPWSTNSLFRIGLKMTAEAAKAEIHFFTSGPAARESSTLHRQQGESFAERLENAVASLAKLGFEEIVAVGRDCPSLRGCDIAETFERLKENRLVLGPDHRGGCYLIGFRASDRSVLHGIRWRRDTDCAELCTRCDESEIFLLATKLDLDTWADLRLLARAGDAAGRLAAFLAQVLPRLGRELDHFVDLAGQAARVRGQLPPPVSSAR